MFESKTTIDLTETLCIETRPGPGAIVIFGASGDLTMRKLLPSLFQLAQAGLLPDNFFILGFARSPLGGTEGFRQQARAAIQAAEKADAQVVDAFCQRCYYLPGDYSDPALYRQLNRELQRLETVHGTGGNAIFYLSIPPTLYSPVVEQLAAAGLLQEASTGESYWRRVIVEKPFGHDLASAQALDAELSQHLKESQLYRIDHYLGKETVQNVLMLRFANAIFEPLWSRHYVDHVQITAAESIGIGHRAGYYEHTGLLRDMFQNHMLQLLALVAMEPPASFAADHVRDEKVKLLSCVRPFTSQDVSEHVVRGQYAGGNSDGSEVPAYRKEEGVNPKSLTETFVAARFFIDNWRWQGVPFYLRSGKRLARKRTEIAITFKSVPHSIFEPLTPEHLTPNTLVLNVQPDEGIGLTIQAKRPGPKLCMAGLTMSFNYREVFGGDPPEAYGRLLLDTMLGDQTLFIRNDNVELGWRLLMPIINAWESGKLQIGADLHPYPAGSWGPPQANELIAADGRKWRE
jgi:glucose-6-phosphate 1-dehydrogenase